MPKYKGMSDQEFQQIKQRLIQFMEEDIYPNELEYLRQCQEQEHHNQWVFPEILIDLKRKAKSIGNFFSFQYGSSKCSTTFHYSRE